jgi:hypothetical protein
LLEELSSNVESDEGEPVAAAKEDLSRATETGEKVETAASATSVDIAKEETGELIEPCVSFPLFT